MDQSQDLGELLERLGVRKSLEDAIKDTAKEAALSGTNEVLEVTGHAALAALPSQLLKGAAAGVASVLLRLILGTGSLNKKLDLLVNAPMQTGVDEARLTLSLHPESESEYRFRDRRLGFAIGQFAIAAGQADEQQTAVGAQFMARLLQGLCSKETTGGEEYARTILGQCVEQLRTEIGRLRIQISELHDYVAEQDDLAIALLESPERAMTTMHGDLHGISAGAAASRANQSRTAIQNLNARIGWLMNLRSILGELSGQRDSSQS